MALVLMTPQDLVKGIGDLVSLPGVAMRISEMVNDTRYSATDIGKVISQDPGLTVHLLKIANSPLYGLSSTIDTVSRAVTVLGTKQIRDLIVATSAIKAFEGIPNKFITMDDFWLHSIGCGLAASELIRKQRTRTASSQSESIFVAGLLHDIGQLVIFNKLPEQASEILEQSMDDINDASIIEFEQQVLGFDHAQVGGELIKEWQLPPLLFECVAFHHQPSLAAECKKEVAIVHIANALSVMAELNTDNRDDADVPPLDPCAWEFADIDSNVADDVIAVVKEQLAEVSSLFIG